MNWTTKKKKKNERFAERVGENKTLSNPHLIEMEGDNWGISFFFPC